MAPLMLAPLTMMSSQIPFIHRKPPFRLIPTPPLVMHPPPIIHRVPFYGEMIKVTIAKKVHQVEWWIISRVLPLIHSHPDNKFVVGLDTEWRPNLKPGEDHPIAILQLCIGNECLIYQFLHGDPIPPISNLRTFFNDPRFIFCGVGVEEDVKKLKENHGLSVRNMGDLSHLANYRYMGLKKMALSVLGKEMAKPKNVTLSAWDAADLDDNQVEYAAIDAFVSFQLAFALRFALLGGNPLVYHHN